MALQLRDEKKRSVTPDWLIWASPKADWYDLFVEGDDEMLSNVKRETSKQINQRIGKKLCRKTGVTIVLRSNRLRNLGSAIYSKPPLTK